jgi:3-methyladenine DNA glycosylase AlkC
MAAFKDELGTAAVDQIATAFHGVDAAFPHTAFRKQALAGLDELELKARLAHLIAAIHVGLCRSCGVPDASSGEVWAAYLRVLESACAAGLKGFVAWPLIDYVSVYGRDRPAASLSALARMTSAFSAEFALRPFLLHDVEATLQQARAWTASEDEHVRRLASEGTRPVLPWGIAVPALKADPTLALPILHALREDPADYVRRSVANHMNDHAKLHAEFVLETIAEWGGMRLPWAKHALRTLIKQAHPGVWPLLGFEADSPVKLELQAPDPARVRVGGEIRLVVQLSNPSALPQKVMLDYQLHFVRARGPRSIKVFKLRELELSPGETRRVDKRHSFRPVTTRRDYPGVHRLVLQLNGRTEAGFDFELLAEGS